MKTPQSIYDYDMDTRGKKLFKQEEVLGGFIPTITSPSGSMRRAATAPRFRCLCFIAKGLSERRRNPPCSTATAPTA